MSELASPSAEPSYISRLALKSAPFSQTVDANSFFNGKQVEQRLNLLLHLVQATNQIGLLIAKPGVGKSCLLAQLQLKAGDGLRTCTLNSESTRDVQSLALQCLTAFGIDTQGVLSGEALADKLTQRFTQLQKINIKPLLLVDDFELLPEEVRTEIIKWLHWRRNDTFLLQAIITATADVSEFNLLQQRIQHVDLPELSEQESATYLLQRLLDAGYQGASPFSSKEMQRFYQQSSGNPAKLNQLAHQKLLGIHPSFVSPVNINVTVIVRWLGILAISVLLISLLVYQSDINELFSSDEADNELIKLPELIQEELATVVVEDDAILSSEQAERNELLLLIDELTVQSDEQVVAVQQREKSLQPSTLILTADAEVSAISVEQADLYQQDWILKQRATDYTFQLMGSWQHQEVTEFIEKYALVGDVAEFESIRNGRVWYALVYGVYNSKQTALTASSSWPAPLNTLPSWLRRFDSVQKQISKKAQAQ